LGKLPTRDNLEKRQIVLLSIQCPLCNSTEKTVQHVLFECVVTQKVCDNCDRWIDIHSVRPNFAASHFMSFNLIRCRKKVNSMWRGMWVAIVWELWKHRNNVVFNDRVVDDSEIFVLAQLRGWSWTKFKPNGVSVLFQIGVNLCPA